MVKVKLKADIALHGNPSQSYGTSLAIFRERELRRKEGREKGKGKWKLGGGLRQTPLSLIYADYVPYIACVKEPNVTIAGYIRLLSCVNLR